jgi:hypothetical protein
VTQEDLYNHPGWELCTSRGARDQVLLLDLDTTFREKLTWLEEAENLSRLFSLHHDEEANVDTHKPTTKE